MAFKDLKFSLGEKLFIVLAFFFTLTLQFCGFMALVMPSWRIFLGMLGAGASIGCSITVIGLYFYISKRMRMNSPEDEARERQKSEAENMLLWRTGALIHRQASSFMRRK